MPARRWGPAVLILILGPALAGDGGRAADVPRPVSGEMVLARVEPDELTKYLHGVMREALQPPAPDDKAVAKARATAVLIAARAQNGRGARAASERAALRDNALKVQKALAEDRLAAARKYADALLDIGGVPADLRRVALKDLIELDEVELLMRARRFGGLGVGAPNGNRDSIEIKFMTLARKAPTPADLDKEAAELARAASVAGGMADLLDAYTPDKKVGNKDPNDWKAQTAEMRAGASLLEAAAKAKDPNRVRAAALRLTASCNMCHEVFRD